MNELVIKELVRGRVFLFQQVTKTRVSKEEVTAFRTKIQQLAQSKYPNHGYNLFVGSEQDSLQIILVLDISDFLN